MTDERFKNTFDMSIDAQNDFLVSKQTLKTLFNIYSSQQVHQLLESASRDLKIDDSTPETIDRIRILSEIVQFVQSEPEKIDKTSQNALNRIVIDFCDPILASNVEKRFLDAILTLKWLCLDATGRERWAQKCDRDLNVHFGHLKGGTDPNGMDVKPEVAMRILMFLFDKSDRRVSKYVPGFARTLDLAFSCCEMDFSVFVCVEVVPGFINGLARDEKIDAGIDLWVSAKRFFRFDYSDCVSKNCATGYLIMFNLFDLLAKEKSILSIFLKRICEDRFFWLFIRYGLAHDDTQNRKRTIFVLKKSIECIDNIDSVDFKCGLDFTWVDFVLLVEILEETQVHVIKPVLGKIDFLGKSKSSLDRLTIIFHRMFKHDSKFVRKWALERFLMLDLSGEGCIDIDFICNPLLNVLNDPVIFTRCPDEPRGSLPGIASCLSHFFNRSMQICDEKTKSDLFTALIAHVRRIRWAPVPLLYVSHALSTLPAMSGVWGSAAVDDLKDLMVDSLRTQEKYLKVAIHCFLLEAFLKLVKKDELTFDSLSSFLHPFTHSGALTRKTNLWHKTIQFLHQPSPNQLLTPQSAISFIQQITTDFNSTQDIFIADSLPRRTSLVLLLSLDANFTRLPNTPEAQTALLQPLKSLLLTIDTRPYVPTADADRGLKFVAVLLSQIGQDAVSLEIADWIRPCVTPMVDYALTKTARIVQRIEDLERLRIYLKLVEAVARIEPDPQKMAEWTEKLTDVGLGHFDCSSQSLLGLYSGVTCLAHVTRLVGDRTDLCAGKKIEKFVKEKLQRNIFNDALTKSTAQVDCEGLKGRMTSEFYQNLWICVEFYAKRNASDVGIALLMDSAVHTLEIGTDVVAAVCSCVAHVLPRVLDENEEIFLKFVHFAWNVMFERRKSDVFWVAVESFIKMALQPAILGHDKCGVLIGFFDKAHELADTTPKIFHLFALHCFDVWRKSSGNHRNIEQHAKFIADALTFGPVHRKDQRVSSDADAFVYSLGDACAVNSLVESDHLDEVSVRAAAVSLVCNLGAENQLIRRLIPLLHDTDSRISSTRRRFYANSLIHLTKNRIWQTFLVLEPLCGPDILADVLSRIYKQLTEEGTQLSIRLVQEWLAARILIRFPLLRAELWAEVEKAAEIRVGSVGSFLGIVYHVAKVLGDEEFVVSALKLVLMWCMAQNFNTRVTAQVIFRKLWSICQTNKMKTAISTFAPVESCLKLGPREGGNSARCTTKMSENFYFKILDFEKHMTFQTIFHDILRLTNVSDYEWIPTSVFAKFHQNPSTVAIFNAGNELDLCENESKAENDELDEMVTGNVQKKMSSWKKLVADENCASETGSGELIVVASLIDKMPNLGGLCRSCEIFGAKEYVMANVKCVDEKQFQNLSVSAEKWTRISEVKPHQLRNYLLSKRSEGYALIGAEQTANSIRAHNYKFPRKCLLLLGNEKEGIPVSLIQLLDACVEIPQCGVIRSLNVHVCGALLIWEYSRQNSQFSQIS